MRSTFDVNQLGVDAGHVRRIALIVVVDELDWAAEQPALGVDVVAPGLQRDQKLLAVLRHAAGHRHAEADLDRLGGSSARAREKQDRRKDRQCDGPAPHRQGAIVHQASRHGALPFLARRPELNRFRLNRPPPIFSQSAFLARSGPLAFITASFRRPA
jgi:hypothetical protein